MTPTQRKAMERALAHMVSFEAGTGGLYRGEFSESITALRAALAEQPAEQKPVAQRWQPIETAPKGRIVLVYYKNSLGNGRTMRARYYLPETLDSDTTESGWADEGWYEESEAYEYLMPLEHDPTHWMPLPAGPDTAPQPKAEQQEPKKDLMWSTVAMQRRHDERIGRIVNTLEQIKQEQLAEQPTSLDWVSLNKAADEIVRSKPTWKRFIDGTPLANDIACWMADFALEHTAPQPAKRVPLTREHVRAAGGIVHSDGNVFFTSLEHLISAVESANGITGETK